MKRFWMITMLALLATVTAAWAAGPVAVPHGGTPTGDLETMPANKAFGDPTDFLAAALAGGDYLVMMQSDIWEDNAGNGGVGDQDLEDGGWDWALAPFEHSANASSLNLYGVTALGLLASYELDPKIEYFRAMKDAADFIVTSGPTMIRSGPDVSFLLRFADLADCPDPAYYRAGAQAIWDRQITTYGTMANLAAYIRDSRGASYPNGIIPWDISAWVVSAMDMHAAFPGMGHDLEADTIAMVIYQDSFNGSPGFFDPYGINQVYDPVNDPVESWWYVLGVQGMIRSFALSGEALFTAEIPGLVQLLLDSQNVSGGFSDGYGGNDVSWQATAYTLETLAGYVTMTPTIAAAVYDGAVWLAATQAPEGGWVYSSGNHYPEIGGENTRGLAAAYPLVAPALEIDLDDAGPIDCGETNLATIRYVPAAGTPDLRGYDITFEVTGGVAYPIDDDIDDLGNLGAYGPHAYYEVDNGTSWTVSDAILGGSAGVDVATDLFTVLITPTGDGPATVAITDYRLRQLDNTPLFADVTGAEFEIDCTPPPVVTDVAAATAHHRVDVSWVCAEVDVDHYEIYRAVRHDGTPGVSAYPEYDDLPGYALPTLPLDRDDALTGGEWELAGTVPAGTFAFTDDGMDERGVYHYVVFAVDTTPLYGPTPAADAWAFNYWLGDVFDTTIAYPLDHDGFVASDDITTLGAAFGSVDGPVPYNNEVDVGPTDDWSGTGFPETDNVIDFEDLMIFALNYGNVGPTKARPDYDATPPVLAWSRADDGDWVLTLSEACVGLKGLHVRAALPEGAVASLTPGALLAGQIDPVFFMTGEGLDANIAIMGAGKGFTGAGELLRVRVDGGEPGALVVDARGLDNAKLDGSVTDGGQTLPRAFAVRPNYPNPFNPKTTISFDLPRTSQVTVGVYGLDGRLVRTLLNDERTAGTHEVVWDGLDGRGQQAASGTYVYRVRAAGFESNRKMLLMK